MILRRHSIYGLLIIAVLTLRLLVGKAQDTGRKEISNPNSSFVVEQTRHAHRSPALQAEPPQPQPSTLANDLVEIPESAVAYFVPAVSLPTLRLGEVAIDALQLDPQQVAAVNKAIEDLIGSLQEFELNNSELIQSEGEAYFLLPNTHNYSRYLRSQFERTLSSSLPENMRRLLLPSIFKSLPEFDVPERQLSLLDIRNSDDGSRVYLHVRDTNSGNVSTRAIPWDLLDARYGHLFGLNKEP